MPVKSQRCSHYLKRLQNLQAKVPFLPFLSKVFKRIVLNQTKNLFLSLSKTLYDYQSSFREKHSINKCLSFLNDKILGDFIDCLLTSIILIAPQKAFDTINHDIVLSKLSIIVFSDDTVKWFKSYLSNHKFSLNLENCFLEISDILCGVPKRSIFGLLLFLAYVNDMLITVKCNLRLCVHDSCLVFQSKNVQDVENQLN